MMVLHIIPYPSQIGAWQFETKDVCVFHRTAIGFAADLVPLTYPMAFMEVTAGVGGVHLHWRAVLLGTAVCFIPNLCVHIKQTNLMY